MKQQKRVQPTSKKKEESLSYAVEVRDKEGRVLQRISAPSRSYVQQWNQLINTQARQVVNPAILDISGVEHGGSPDSLRLYAAALIGNVSSGLRVGKGTTAVAIDDYALGTPLEEGTGTDEFNHQAVTFTVPSVAGSTCSFTIARTMINNSGATITGIKEIGCYHRYSYSHMGFRDVLPSPVSVPHGGSITVTYTIRATV